MAEEKNDKEFQFIIGNSRENVLLQFREYSSKLIQQTQEKMMNNLTECEKLLESASDLLESAYNIYYDKEHNEENLQKVNEKLTSFIYRYNGVSKKEEEIAQLIKGIFHYCEYNNQRKMDLLIEIYENASKIPSIMEQENKSGRSDRAKWLIVGGILFCSNLNTLKMILNFNEEKLIKNINELKESHELMLNVVQDFKTDIESEKLSSKTEAKNVYLSKIDETLKSMNAIILSQKNMDKNILNTTNVLNETATEHSKILEYVATCFEQFEDKKEDENPQFANQSLDIEKDIKTTA